VTDQPGPAETPDLAGAYPRLPDLQLEALAARGERRATREGEVLFREGDRGYDFFVVLSGKLAIVEDYNAEGRVISVHGARRFVGEFSALAGQPAFATAVMVEAGEVLAVPVDHLRALALADPALGDVVLRAFLLRRSLMIDRGTGFRIVGSSYSPDTRRLREFAARNRLPHRFLDVEQDPDAEAFLRTLGVRPDETPVVILGGHQVLRNPRTSALARLVGVAVPPSGASSCDLVVVGAGPTGLAAAVYAASEGMATQLLDAVATGGQAGLSSRIENYLGFPSGISGAELAERAAIQARKFGAALRVPAEATSLEDADGEYALRLCDGDIVRARTILVATGAHYRRLDVPRLEEFEGSSVYYAATVQEARWCRNDPVAVIGGGNSAAQAALFLSEQVASVRLLIRGGDLSADMSRYLADRIERGARIEVLLETEVRELVGDHTLDAIVVEQTRTGERRRLDAHALFVFIGVDPCTSWLGGQLDLDEDGFVVTGAEDTDFEQRAGRSPLLLETSLPGVFAAGDVRSGSVKRVASGVGEGAMVVRLVYEHLKRHSGVAPTRVP